MSNRNCDCWLKLGCSEYDVILVEYSSKLYQFAQVLVTRKSTQSSQFTHMSDSARARMLDGAHECSYLRVHSSASANLY